MKLTNQEIARVFAMYLGCELRDDYNSKIGSLTGVDLQGGAKIKYNFIHSINQDECKLLLTPLNKISDEHAIGLLSKG